MLAGHRVLADRDALCQTVRALESALQKANEVVEEGIRANTTLREQLAEAAAKIEWQASTIEQLTTGVTGCAERLAQVEKERDGLRTCDVCKRPVADRTCRLHGTKPGEREEALRPIGWQTAQIAFDNPRMVKVIFETPECAEAFIDGIEPADGPIIAATRMRDVCVERVRASGVYWREVSKQFQRGDEEFAFFTAKAKAADDIERDLQSLTLDQVEKKQ